MAGVWATPITAPFDVGLMLLLTDGSVLAQNAGTSLWWRLRPDRAGRYAQGEWRPTASSTSAPRYFASAVLRDGRVFVAGGELSNNSPQQADLCTAELYDPVAETWRACRTPDGWTAIGDAPCCVLPDGRVLLGNINAGACAIWDPATGHWTATGPKRNGTSNEETFTLLPDGSVLTADCVDAPATERFSNGAWIVAGDTPAPLVEAASSEIGPAILLPDGSVFAIGATGATARYVPGTGPALPGAWTAGPAVPSGDGGGPLGAKDAPACLLPNGRVLCAVGPVDGVKDHYLGPTSFFEFDPGTAGWSPAIPPAPGTGDLAPYNFVFLLLPTGEVLVSDGTRAVRIFQPDGAPDPAWAPAIQDCPATAEAGATVRLRGSRLNGLSQACCYGDDAAMATNYPIVRLRGPFPSDAVTYGRTSGHSTMAVATGSALHHTDVTVPTTATAGNYHLCVVANGIASAEVPFGVAAARAPRAARPPAGADATPGPTIFDEEALFRRDLSEVHLLIDFISGRPEKSLAGLADAVTLGIDGDPVEHLSAQSVIEGICRISYPPQGPIEANAQQAAYMLIVKDKLNALASPARGLTVAFTAMFAGTAIEYPEPKPRDRKFYSAREAFPNLERQARRFRRFFDRLPWVALVLVALIAYTNWDVNVTTSVLGQIGDADRAYAKLVSTEAPGDPSLLVVCPPPPAESPKPTDTVSTAAPVDLAKPAGANSNAVAAAPIDPAKLAGAVASAVAPTTIDSVKEGKCRLLVDARERRAAAYSDLHHLLTRRFVMRPVALSVRLFGPSIPKYDIVAGPDAPRNAIARAEVQNVTVAVVGGLTGILVPVGFAWLGTLAGLMRSITGKVSTSVLAPRDHQLARVAIFLGMTAGLAIGLFFNVTETGAGISSSLGNNITVTAAGLSFLAGFGAEVFFTFLEGAAKRLMPPP